jgi:hypothetical protein
MRLRCRTCQNLLPPAPILASSFEKPTTVHIKTAKEAHAPEGQFIFGPAPQHFGTERRSPHHAPTANKMLKTRQIFRIQSRKDI